MPYGTRWALLPIAMIGLVLLAGCASRSEDAPKIAPAQEHTTSKPPPGIVEQQQARAKQQATAAQQKPPK